MPGLRIDILSSRLEVRAQDGRIIDKLADIFGCFPARSGDPVRVEQADLVLEVERAGDGYRMVREGETLLETDCPAYLVACLEHRFFEEAIGLDAEHLLLHAGAVARAGKGLILPGDKGAGKSTLVACLVHGGFSYLSDETAAIAYETQKMIAVPRAMHMKDAAPLKACLGSGGLRLDHYWPGDDDYPARYLLPPAERVAREPVEPRAILFCSYSPSAPTSLVPVKGGRAVGEILRQSLEPFGDVRQQFELVADLVTGCEVFELEYSDLDEALRFCERLLD